jgi:hypothetical protein
VIDFCLQRDSEACAIFVDRLGLKTLFAAFIKKGSTKKNSKKNKKGFSEKDDDGKFLILDPLVYLHSPF